MVSTTVYKTPMQRKLVNEPGTWEKFEPSGVAKRHPGSTFVSYLVVDSPLYQAGERIIADVRAMGMAGDFGLLPPSSLHMTVMEGLKEPSLLSQDEKWPEWLARYESFPEAVAAMRVRLAEADIRAPRDVVMRPSGVAPIGERLTIDLVPATDAMATELDRFRREVGAVLEMPVPGLDEYRFHNSLGYRLTEPTDEDAEVREAMQKKYEGWVRTVDQADLEPVAFQIFNDMLSFSPLLYFR